MVEKQKSMTNRERVEALLRGEKPDRVPIWPFAQGFSGIYSGISIAEVYNNPKLSLETQRKTSRDFDWLSMPLVCYALMGGWEFGGEIKWPSGEFSQAPTITTPIVSTPEEALELTLPDIRKAGIVPYIIEFAKMALEGRDDNEPFRLTLQLEGTFNTAANIAGTAKLTKWILKKPEAAHHLLRLATDFLVGLAEFYKEEFGTESIAFFGGEPSSSNQVISPKHFENFAFPYIKETHERILALGFDTFLTHICGEQNLNLSLWSKVPMGNPGLVTFGHEVDLDKAAEFFPSDIILGNLEPAIIQTGTPEEVYEAAKKVVLQGKNLPNGFIFAPGCELPPKAPVENVKAMSQAVADHGWYE